MCNFYQKGARNQNDNVHYSLLMWGGFMGSNNTAHNTDRSWLRSMSSSDAESRAPLVMLLSSDDHRKQMNNVAWCHMHITWTCRKLPVFIAQSSDILFPKSLVSLTYFEGVISSLCSDEFVFFLWKMGKVNLKRLFWLNLGAKITWLGLGGKKNVN